MPIGNPLDLQSRGFTRLELFELLEKLFSFYPWSSSYGNQKWGYVAHIAQRLEKAKDPLEYMLAFDRVIHACHCSSNFISGGSKYEWCRIDNNFLAFLDFKREAFPCCWLNDPIVQMYYKVSSEIPTAYKVFQTEVKKYSHDSMTECLFIRQPPFKSFQRVNDEQDTYITNTRKWVLMALIKKLYPLAKKGGPTRIQCKDLFAKYTNKWWGEWHSLRVHLRQKGYNIDELLQGTQEG